MSSTGQRTTGYAAAAIAIVVLALAVRALLLVYLAPQPLKFYTPDSFGYDQLAVNLLEHGVFSSQQQPPFDPDFKRTPGYPAMIAAIYAVAGHAPAAVVFVQVLLGALMSLLVLVLARMLGLPRQAGLIAATLVAVEPVSIMATSQLLTETLYTFALMAAVALLAAWRLDGRYLWILLASVLVGYGALVRPIGQFLPIVLAPVVLAVAWRRGMRPAAVSLFLFLAVSLGITYSWAYHNSQLGGGWTLSTVSDINLVYYRAREVLASSEGLGQEQALQEMERRVAAASATMSRTDAERQQALSVFRNHPAATGAMLAKGAARIFVDPGLTAACTLLDRETLATECFSGEASMNESGLAGKVIERLSTMSAVQLGVLAWSLILSAVLYFTSLIGLIHLVKERRWFALAVLLVPAAYLVLLSSGSEAYSRFRIPIIPQLAILAPVGMSYVLRRRVSYLSPQPSED